MKDKKKPSTVQGELTEEEKAYVDFKGIFENKYGEIAGAEEFIAELREDGYTREEAVAFVRRRIEDWKELDRIIAIQEAIDKRPVEKSYDYQAAKEHAKGYFARITGDIEAKEKADKKKRRLLKKIDEEREIEIDVSAAIAARRFLSVIPIAQTFKYKNLAHYHLIYLNCIAARYVSLLEEERSRLKPNAEKEHAARTIETTVGIAENELLQIAQNIICARLLEAMTDSPHLYPYIGSMGNELDSKSIYEAVLEDVESFLEENKEALNTKQIERVTAPLKRVRAAQSNEVAKVCKRIMKQKQKTLEAAEDVLAIYLKNRAAIDRAIEENMKKQGGEYGE